MEITGRLNTSSAAPFRLAVIRTGINLDNPWAGFLTGPSTLDYEFTDADPNTWTRPWAARIPWVKIDPEEQMYEYACHEDNYDMVHFLSGARARDGKLPVK